MPSSTRPAVPAAQRDRGDHKIDELTRQVSLNCEKCSIFNILIVY